MSEIKELEALAEDLGISMDDLLERIDRVPAETREVIAVMALDMACAMDAISPEHTPPRLVEYGDQLRDGARKLLREAAEINELRC
jgi:hypothetical protein